MAIFFYALLHSKFPILYKFFLLDIKIIPINDDKLSMKYLWNFYTLEKFNLRILTTIKFKLRFKTSIKSMCIPIFKKYKITS